MSSPSKIRNGLSIVEVLTSIVVAMIGVFGVMVLIPFAVKQAKTGLDSDAAVSTALNAYQQFEITGMRNPGNWANVSGAYDPFGTSADPPMVFSLDPLGVADPDVLFAGAQFPFMAPPLPAPQIDANLEIPAATFRDPQGQNFTQEMARRMCRSANDLVFSDDSDDFAGPQQIYDRVGGVNVRRQSVGRISWSAIVVPFKNGTGVGTRWWSYRMYILVYKDRQLSIDGSMAVARVTTASGVQSPLTNVTISSELGGINRDDWVLLINQDTGLEPGFDKQLGFCRVVNFASGATSSLTLDGPDFNITADTYMIHLKDVIGVYERTFTPESDSAWNISF